MLNSLCWYCPHLLIVSPSGLLHVLVYLLHVVWFFRPTLQIKYVVTVAWARQIPCETFWDNG